ncbi:MAG: hypothetical protein ACK559_24580, partial [bacterium]
QRPAARTAGASSRHLCRRAALRRAGRRGPATPRGGPLTLAAPCHHRHQPAAGEQARRRLRHGRHGSVAGRGRRVVGPRVEEPRREKVCRIENVDDAVVAEIALVPTGKRARIELPASQEVRAVQ